MSESTPQPSPVPRASEPDADDNVDQAAETETERFEGENADSGGDIESFAGATEATGGTSRTRGFLRRVVRPRALLSLLVIAALVAGIALLGISWDQDNALHEAQSSAVDSAREYAVALTSYDYKDLQGDFDKVSSNAAGEFAKDYKKVSGKLTKLIKKHKAVSKGNVVDAGLVDGDRHRAVVLLFVDQTITNSNNSKPRIDRNRMRMTLLYKNDSWLIDNVELL